MKAWRNSAGEVLRDASGNVLLCDDCPCPGTGTGTEETFFCDIACPWPCALYATFVYDGTGTNCLDGLTIPLSCTGDVTLPLFGMVPLPAGCGAPLHCVAVQGKCELGQLTVIVTTGISADGCVSLTATPCDISTGVIAIDYDCTTPTATYAFTFGAGGGCIPVLGSAQYLVILHT